MNQLVLVDNRAFAHYRTWECWSSGFYEDCNNECQAELAAIVLGRKDLFDIACQNVIHQWPISAAVHLTNTTINRNAWLGQSATFLKHNICRNCTKIAWRTLTKTEQTTANQIASRNADSYRQQVIERESCPTQNGQLAFQF